ncbi:MAG: HEAT repeat domain-containing protein [Deltaproteobacteria bacterium]|nr:HEAT repeat domain-containing protein [Deltaproteobacteria bacterium]
MRPLVQAAFVALFLSISSGAAEAQRSRLERIERALFDRDVKVRLHAAYALSRIGDPSSLPALVRALTDKSATVRSLAAFGLGRIGDRRALAALMARRRDVDQRVREQIAEALKRIRSQARPRRRSSGPTIALRAALDRTKSAAGLDLALREYWSKALAELTGETGISLVSGSGPTSYGLSSSITEMSAKRRGSTLAITCRVSMVVEQGQGRIVMMGSGAATVEGASPSWRRRQAMERNAVQMAVSSASDTLRRFLVGRSVAGRQ